MKYRIRTAHLSDCQALSSIWEEAVLSTHDFLAKEDFDYYKSQLDKYFDNVSLFVYEYVGGGIAGFAGVSGDKLEMLFVGERGKGIGKALLDFAVKERRVSKVDVNAQNMGAVGFYRKYGFVEQSTSETDSQGKPYPIISMGIEPVVPSGHPHGHHGSGHRGI